jgi:hypothetical protein
MDGWEIAACILMGFGAPILFTWIMGFGLKRKEPSQ